MKTTTARQAVAAKNAVLFTIYQNAAAVIPLKGFAFASVLDVELRREDALRGIRISDPLLLKRAIDELVETGFVHRNTTQSNHPLKLTLQGLKAAESLAEPLYARLWDRTTSFAAGALAGAVGGAVVQAIAQSDPPWLVWWR